MVKTYEKDFNNKKEYVNYNPEENRFDYAIKDAESVIKFHTKRLEILKERRAIMELIKTNGWEEFDVSEISEQDLTDYKIMMNFIGTQKEFDELNW